MLIKTLFMSSLIAGTMISISATNWISAWIGLELNLLSFIPLMLNDFTKSSSEASLKYFLIQAFASIFLLASMMFMFITSQSSMMSIATTMSLILTLSLKLGAAPLHFWFPGIMQSISWLNSLILMTWQKLAPLILILAMNSKMTSLLAVMSAMIGALGGYNQMISRKILAYSSINHLGWMLTSTMISEWMTIMYFTIYSLMNMIIVKTMMSWNMNHLSQMPSFNFTKNIHLMLATNLLSLGGIPPFLGFLPKWLVISQTMHEMPMQIFILTMSSLITLYFYIRLTYSMILKSYSNSPISKIKPTIMVSMMTAISAMGTLILIPLM